MIEGSELEQSQQPCWRVEEAAPKLGWGLCSGEVGVGMVPAAAAPLPTALWVRIDLTLATCLDSFIALIPYWLRLGHDNIFK